MSQGSPVHDTFTLDKSYPAAPGAVFEAFADASRKKRWYADSPQHECLSYHLDFAVGGQEELRARMLPGTPVAGQILCWRGHYVQIEKDCRIVFFQTLDVGDRRISGALITIEFAPEGTGTSVRLTHQAVYFEGADGPEIRRMGWQHLLDSVGQSLATA